MDPVTHAASGAIAMYVLSSRPATAWAAPLAAICCAAPDIDLVFIHTPLEFLLMHRGITHSFAAMPVFALALALLCWPLWRKSTPDHWSFAKVWLFCCAMILLHIWLDVMTTYGTMVFVPFSHYRVRWNSLFIVDLFITLPLLWAVWRWRAKRALMLFAFVWTFLYPSLGLALNAWHTSQCEARFAEQNRKVTELHVLPDAIGPFFWRVIFVQENPEGRIVCEQSLNVLGQQRAPENIYRATPEKLIHSLSSVSTDCDAFFRFAMLPVMRDLPEKYLPEDAADNARFYKFYDLRFGSGLEFVRKLLAIRPDADIPFILMAEFAPGTDKEPGQQEMQATRVRLRFSDSGKDSGWHVPRPIQKPDFWQWLVGLDLN